MNEIQATISVKHLFNVNLHECKEFVHKNGIQIIGTYIDRALSAKTDNRSDFQRMINVCLIPSLYGYLTDLLAIIMILHTIKIFSVKTASR